MDIEKLTIGEVRELTQFVQPQKYALPFRIGEKYFIRTVTYHLTGRVKEIVGKFLVLEDAAWIADSGRFMAAIETGALAEVEPVTVPVFINTDSICDAFQWKHDLPRGQQ